MDYSKKALEMHEKWRGKIRIETPCPLDGRDDLSVAYTPGVAAPCLEIQKDLEKSFTYTRRGNLVAVVTDGTAVLGLGDIGPEAGMPVMELTPSLSAYAPRTWTSWCALWSLSPVPSAG